MRKLLFVALSGLSISAFGQGEQGFWLGINGAVTGGSLFSHNIHVSSVEMKPDISVNYSGGIEAGYMFHERVGIFVGAGISMYHYMINPKEPPSLGRLIQIGGASTFFDLPVGIKYMYFQRKGFSFFVAAGAKTSLLVDHEIDYRFRNANWDDYRETLGSADSIEVYNNLAVTPFVFLGIHIPAGRFSINIGPEISYQLTNLFKQPYVPAQARSFFREFRYSDWQAHYFNAGLKIYIGFRP